MSTLFNPEAEMAVVGCCLLGGSATTSEATDALREESFYTEEAKAAYRVLESLVAQGKDVSLVTFGVEWGKVNKFKMPEVILEAPDMVPSASNLAYYIDQVAEMAKRRNIVTASRELAKQASDPAQPVDAVIANAEAMLGGHEVESLGSYNGLECCRVLTDHLEERFLLHKAGKRGGLVTGFDQFDYYTDGLQFGEQTIIAARPSVGKTAIGVNIVERVCLRDKIPTLIISLEMSARALTRRLLSSWGRIGMKSLREGNFTSDDFKAFHAFQVELKNSPFHIVDGISGMDCNRVCAVIRRYVRKHGVRFVLIDYLQKVRAATKQEKRTYEVGEVSGALKNVAVKTNVAMLTLAQLNREPEKDKKRLPRLTDLADSAQIERDGDCIGLLHRERSGEGSDKAALVIAKQRDGELGAVNLEYDGRFCRFTNSATPSH